MLRQNKKFAKTIGRYPKTTAAAVVAVGAVVGFLVFGGNDQSAVNPTGEPAPTTQTTQPATTEPAQTGPKETQNSLPAPAPVVDNKKQVNVIITSAGQEGQSVVVRSYVSGVFEDGGLCKATFTKSGSTTVSGTSSGFQNVNYTTCGPIKISRSKFLTAGDWQLKLDYSSVTAQGSAQQSVRIE